MSFLDKAKHKYDGEYSLRKKMEKTSVGLKNHQLSKINNENKCPENSYRVKPSRTAKVPNPEVPVAQVETEETLEEILKKVKQDLQTHKLE